MKLNRLTKMLVTAGVMLAASWGAQATIYTDLLTAGGAATINGALYTQVPEQSAGSGVIQSFVRIATNDPLVQGYNTTANNVFDTGASNTFNHEIKVGDVGFIDVGGGSIMRFLLDINQTGVSPRLSLDDVQIFISTSPNQSVESFTGGGLVNLANSFLVYRQDAGGDHTVELDFSLNSGSGSGDMTLDITAAMLNAAFTAGGTLFDTTAEKNAAYIYVYSRFGTPTYINNDGYEEWAHFSGNPIGEPPCTVNCGPQEIPEPGALSLVGLGLLGAVIASRRRRQS